MLRPSPGTATEDDALALLESPRKRICELIDGTLIEKAKGFRESLLASYLLVLLDRFVRPRNLGLVVGADTFQRLWPGRLRVPDVAFSAWSAFPERRVPTAAIPDLVPDLAIEVLSKSNTRREMALKRDDYFKTGTQLVWEIDPRKGRVSVYTSPKDVTVLLRSDTLTGDPVLPGFSLPLAELFSELDRRG